VAEKLAARSVSRSSRDSVVATFSFENLNFARPPITHLHDVALMATVAVVIAFCEARRHISLGGYRTWQPDRPNGDVGSEGILTSVDTKEIRVRSHGRVVSAFRTFGYAIGIRSFVNVVVRVLGFPPNGGKVAVIVAHMPPLRMRRLLYRVYAYRLRRRIRHFLARDIAVSVCADWNWLVGEDPAMLVKTFGGRWLGERIDAWWVCPVMSRYVDATVEPLGRADNHPRVHLHLHDRPVWHPGT
jgi:hypothetical protein